MRRNKRPSGYNTQPSEHNDPRKYTGPGDARERIHLEHQQVEALIERGFVWEEAVKLTQMHEHIYDNLEVRQRMEENEYLSFARWLYEQGAMNEGWE